MSCILTLIACIAIFYVYTTWRTNQIETAVKLDITRLKRSSDALQTSIQAADNSNKGV